MIFMHLFKFYRTARIQLCVKAYINYAFMIFTKYVAKSVKPIICADR